MPTIKVFAIASLFCSSLFTESIYSLWVDSMDGRTIQLQTYKGRKILFLVVPFSAGDTSISAIEISALQLKYPDLTIFGIPPEDIGYNITDQQKLKTLFKSLPSNFILTEGMNVTKSSGAKQSVIFQWLTNKDKNRHFNNDVRGIGQKFLVDENGELYAVIGPEIKLSNTMIDEIVSKGAGR